MFRSLVSLAAASAILSVTPLAQAPAGQTPSRPGGVGGASTPGAPTPGLPPRDAVQRPQTGTARIRGRVVAAGSNAPLRRVQIVLQLLGSPQSGRVTNTDAEGRYEFTELPAGRFSVSASRPGYVRLQYGQRRPYESGTPIALSAGETITAIDFALPRGGVISGRITDEGGEAMPQVRYLATAIEAMEPNGQYSPEFRRQLQRGAREFTLREGETMSLDLRLTPGF